MVEYRHSRYKRGALALATEARLLTEQAAEKLRLSPPGYARTLRVARNIADLAGVAVIRRQDVAEALAFRYGIPERVLE